MRLFDAKHILCTIVFVVVILLVSPFAIGQAKGTKIIVPRGTKIIVPIITPAQSAFEITKQLKAIVDAFNEKYIKDNIAISLEDVTNWEEVVTEVQRRRNKNKTAGIIIAQPQAIQELIATGGITGLDGVVSTNTVNSLRSKFGDNNCRECNKYSIPFLRSVPVMYYNIPKLNEILPNYKTGGCYNDLPEKWIGELEPLLRAYRAATGEKSPEPLLISGEQYEWLFETMVVQWGGSLERNGQIKLNSEEAIKVLTLWQEWSNEGLMKIADTEKATLNSFIHGYNPIICHSSGSIGEVKSNQAFEYKVGALPRHTGRSSVLHEGVNLYISMYMDDKQKEVAKRFIEFLYDIDVQKQISFESGYLSSVTSSIQNNEDEYLEMVKDEYKNYAEPRMMPKHHTEVYRILREAIKKVTDNGYDPRSALDEAQKNVSQL